MVRWLPRSSGRKLSRSTPTMARATPATDTQRTKWKTSRMTFRKLDTEPGPKARIEFPLSRQNKTAAEGLGHRTAVRMP